MEKRFDDGKIPEKLKDRYEGYCKDLAELITKKLNISCKHTISPIYL